MSEDQFMGNLYQRFPVTIEKGVGAHVWDVDGKEYIDCMGGYGVALVGHKNERVNNAIKEQIDKIITVHSSLYNKTREEFLTTLIGFPPNVDECSPLLIEARISGLTRVAPIGTPPAIPFAKHRMSGAVFQ